MKSLSPELLDVLVCPLCKGKVEASSDRSEIVCKACRLAYPVREGIPVMLADRARRLEAE